MRHGILHRVLPHTRSLPAGEAALYDSVTMTAIGPVMPDPVWAEGFLEWLNGRGAAKERDGSRLVDLWNQFAADNALCEGCESVTVPRTRGPAIGDGTAFTLNRCPDCRPTNARTAARRITGGAARLLTPMEAAEDLAAKLRTEYGMVDAVAWDSEKLDETGWTTADAAVAAEGGIDLSEEQVWERGPFEGGMQPYEGLLLEPYSSWLMCIYRDTAWSIRTSDHQSPRAHQRNKTRRPHSREPP